MSSTNGWKRDSSSGYSEKRSDHCATTYNIKICLEPNVSSKKSRTRLGWFFCFHTQ